MTAPKWRSGPLALAILVTVYGAWQAAHLGGAFWDTDEGLNVIKAYLVQQGAELYTEVWADQPPGLTQLLAWSFDLFAPTMSVARAVVLLHALMLMAALAWIVRTAGAGWPAAIGAAALLGFAPNFYWASRAVMIGLPALSLAVVAIALALAYARGARRRPALLVLAGAAFGLGLLEKLIGAYLVVPIAIAIWARQPDGERERSTPRSTAGHGARFVRDLSVFALGVAPVIAVAALAYDVRAMVEQTVGTVAAARGVSEYALDRAWSIDKLRFWLMGEHRFLIGPAVLGAIVLIRERSTAAAVLLTWLGLTVAALLNQTPLWPKHHFLALLVVMAPVAGIGLDRGGRALARLVRGRGRTIGWARAGDRASEAAAAGAIGATGRAAGDGRAGEIGATSGAGATGRAGALLALGAAAAFLLCLAGLPAAWRGNAMRLEAAPFKENGELPESDAWTKLDEAVELVRRHTAPEDFIVTDHGVLAFRAGRRVPSELAVVSGKRLAVGDLTAERLIEVTRDGEIRTHRSGDLVIRTLEPGQPAAVLFWNGDRLTRIPEFADFVRAEFELAGAIGDDYELWLRPGAARAPSAP